MLTAQDLFNKEFLEDDVKNSNETLDLFAFMKNEGVALNENQIKAMLLLHENGLDDLNNYLMNNRKNVVDKGVYYKLLDKLTLADRIKGNAKLSHLVKTDGGANPAGQLKPQDLQAQGMRRSEIDRY